MQISKTLYVTKRSQWRAWLKKNFKKEKDIWLIFPNKASGKPRLAYADAVEEALCFGWIDSTAKSFNKEAHCQRFSPRRKGSEYSQLNRERMAKMIKVGKVHEDVLKSYKHKKFFIPKNILDEIKKDEQAYKHFKAFPADYKRVRTAFIEDAKIRPELFKKRLGYFLKMTAKNKRFGTFKSTTFK